MVIEVKELGITYYPIPKCGSSSLKYVLMALAGKETAVSSDPENDVHDHLFTNYVDAFSALLDGKDGRFTIVRDPLERLLSAYSGRILKAKVLNDPPTNFERVARFGLPFDPDLNTFILNIEQYCACSEEIRLHVASPRHFIGDSLFAFDRVFKFDRMDSVEAFLSSASGRPVQLPRLQSSDRKVTPSDMSSEALAKAMRFCRYDYGFLVDYYDPARWGGIPKGDPDEFSSLHVVRHPALVHGRIVYPRTLSNLGRFLGKRSMQYRR